MQQKILIGLALTLIIVIFIPVYWAMESGRQEAAGERQKAEAVERGAGLYISSCASCHGAQGEGKIGPPLKDTQLDETVLEKIISRGSPGTAMPALSEDEGGSLKNHEIRDVVIFIENWDSALLEELVAEDATIPTTVPTSTPALSSTSDLVVEGRQLFSELGCIACHKINGEGGEVGPSMVGLFGSARELDTEEKVAADREYLEESIEDPGAKVVKGYPAVMPKSSLSDGQIDALIEFIESLAE